MLPLQLLKSKCLLLYLPVLSPKDAYNTWISPLVLLTSPKNAHVGCILQGCPLRMFLYVPAPFSVSLKAVSKLHSFA